MADTTDREKSEKKQTGRSAGYAGMLGILCALTLFACAAGYILELCGVIPSFSPFFRGWWILPALLLFGASILSAGPGTANVYWFAAFAVTLAVYNRTGRFGDLVKCVAAAGLLAIGWLIFSKSSAWKTRRINDGSGKESLHFPVVRAMISPRYTTPGCAEVLESEDAENAKKNSKKKSGNPSDDPEDYRRGAMVFSLFAPVTLDLSAVDFSSDALIDVVSVFGRVNLLLPKDCGLCVHRRFSPVKAENTAVNAEECERRGTVFVEQFSLFSRLYIGNR